MILWDASMPRIENPKQYPHMMYWTSNGLVKKILLSQIAPRIDFWLAQNQLDLMDDNAESYLWPGEMVFKEDIATSSESESDGDGDGDVKEIARRKVKKSRNAGAVDVVPVLSEKNRIKLARREKRKNDRKKSITFGKSDVRDRGGAALDVIVVEADGSQAEAMEYVPGGELIFALQVPPVFNT